MVEKNIIQENNVYNIYLFFVGKFCNKTFLFLGLLRLTAVISKIWGTSTADPWIKRNTTDINDVISSLLGAVVTHLVLTEPATCSKGTLTESGMEMDNHMVEEKDAINDVKGILCSLSPGLHSALWDILVEVLMDVPGLLESYVTKLKDRLSQGNNYIFLKICY